MLSSNCEKMNLYIGAISSYMSDWVAIALHADGQQHCRKTTHCNHVTQVTNSCEELHFGRRMPTFDGLFHLLSKPVTSLRGRNTLKALRAGWSKFSIKRESNLWAANTTVC